MNTTNRTWSGEAPDRRADSHRPLLGNRVKSAGILPHALVGPTLFEKGASYPPTSTKSKRPNTEPSGCGSWSITRAGLKIGSSAFATGSSGK